MKKILFSSLAALLTIALFAQPPHPDGPPKPPPIAERWKHDSVKLQLYVVLSSSQISNVKTAFVSFYNEMDALMQVSKMLPAREDVEKVRSKRDGDLKLIFNAQQFDRFETFEKEFMPPPPHSPMSREPAEKV